MLIAQITDTHLGFEPGRADEPNRLRLARVLAHIATLDRTPDLLLVTGDLVDRGDEDSYRILREMLAAADMPVHLCLGNHDRRAAFRAAFPEAPVDAGGFVQYVVETAALRLIVLDTLEEGRHGGAFCEARAAWLAARLAEERARPTLIVLHHPPFDTGIPWITTAPDEPWVARLRAALQGAGNLVGLVAGHVHRPLVSGWAGVPAVVCPSAAPNVALTMTPIDPGHADGRAMIVDTPPGLALHWWTGAALVTHFADAAAPSVLARYDEGLRAAVGGMLRERPASASRPGPLPPRREDLV